MEKLYVSHKFQLSAPKSKKNPDSHFLVPIHEKYQMLKIHEIIKFPHFMKKLYVISKFTNTLSAFNL